jgi:hypothetical protein
MCILSPQPWRGVTMLTGAWLGFLDSGSNETDKTAPGDDHGRLVDADGKNVFGCAYRAERLTRAGTIGARAVKCIRRIRTSKRFVQSSALKRRKSTELTGASDRPIVGSHDSVSVSRPPLAALMSVDAKTYVARPAQARLTKTGRLARTASAQRTSRSLRRARHHERAQDCDREPTGSTVDF